MIIYALIPCSKAKAEHICRARDMYWPSPSFRGAFRVAEKAGQRPLILSAKYGLLLPEQPIVPYDVTLIGQPWPMRKKWAEGVLLDLARLILTDDKVVSYLGDVYGEFLLPELRQIGLSVAEPLKGMGLGKRLAWFKRNGGSAGVLGADG